MGPEKNKKRGSTTDGIYTFCKLCAKNFKSDQAH